MSGPHSSESGKPPARRMSLSVKLLVAFVIVISVGGVVLSVFFNTFTVPTGSMENAIMAGDCILVDTWNHEPARGKIIVFEFPGYRDQVKPDEMQYYMKRCVALPGDTLEVRNNAVYINGVAQPVPPGVIHGSGVDRNSDYLMTFPEGARYTSANWGPMRIPKQGDRLLLNDSTYYRWQTFIGREGHSVQRNGSEILIDGRSVTQYVVERDYCFGMGDNRDNSLDSRYWGFIPVESISGSPRWVYWSFASEGGPEGAGVRWDRIFKTVE